MKVVKFIKFFVDAEDEQRNIAKVLENFVNTGWEVAHEQFFVVDGKLLYAARLKKHLMSWEVEEDDSDVEVLYQPPAPADASNKSSNGGNGDVVVAGGSGDEPPPQKASEGVESGNVVSDEAASGGGESGVAVVSEALDAAGDDAADNNFDVDDKRLGLAMVRLGLPELDLSQSDKTTRVYKSLSEYSKKEIEKIADEYVFEGERVTFDSALKVMVKYGKEVAHAAMRCRIRKNFFGDSTKDRLAWLYEV